MMSFKQNMVKLFFLGIFSGLLLTAFMVGCGGGNNPTGPVGSATNPATTAGVLPTTATGSVNLSGLILNASTGNLIDSTTASIVVKATLIGTSFSKSVLATENKAFTIFELPAGNYLVEVYDAASTAQFYKTSLIKEITGDKVDLTVQLSPVNPVPGRISFFGKVLDAAFSDPVQFVTIKVESDSGLTFEVSTLFDGSFSMLDLASGTYNISFTKAGFETASRTLTLINDEIRIGTNKVNLTTDLKNFTDGDNVTRTGYDLGTIFMAPKILETGGISGILLDSSKVPITGVPLDLVYDNNINDGIPPASIIPNFQTNSLGYFLAKNLPQGFYLVAYPGYVTIPIISPSGSIVGYNFGRPAAPNTPDSTILVTRVWLEVKSGSITPIPELQ
ncbi:MAG: carboxypeptidase regulatory-like domain-containing protein [Candidatus Riflebacteria bacterium]